MQRSKRESGRRKRDLEREGVRGKVEKVRKREREKVRERERERERGRERERERAKCFCGEAKGIGHEARKYILFLLIFLLNEKN